MPFGVATTERPGGSGGGGGVSEAELNAAVAAAVAGLVDSAPGSLDTLNELAASLGDDANYAATVTAALAGKASSDQGALADSAVQPGDGADVLNAPAFTRRLAAVSSQDLGTVLAAVDGFASVDSGLFFPDPAATVGGSYSGGEDEWTIAALQAAGYPSGGKLLVVPDDDTAVNASASDGVFVHDGSGTFTRLKTFSAIDGTLPYLFLGQGYLVLIATLDGVNISTQVITESDPTVANLTNDGYATVVTNDNGTWTIGLKKTRTVPFVSSAWFGGYSTTPMQAFRAGDQASPEVRLPTATAVADGIDGSALNGPTVVAVAQPADEGDRGFWEVFEVAANGANNGYLEVDDFADPKPSEGDIYFQRTTELNGRWVNDSLFGGTPVYVGNGDTYAGSYITTVQDGMSCDFAVPSVPLVEADVAALQTVAATLDWHASEPEVIADHSTLTSAGLDAFLDGDAGFIKDTSGRLWMAGFKSSEEVGFVPLNADETEWDFADAATIAVSGLPGGFLGSGGPIVDLGSGSGMMVLHLEGNKYHKLSAGKVTMDADGPVSVVYLGDILEPEESQADAITNDDNTLSQGTGNFLVSESEGSEHVRVFYMETPDDGSFEQYVAIAKCAKSAIATAIAGDTAPSFKKWAGEDTDASWTEDGLTGLGSPLPQQLAGPRAGAAMAKLHDGLWITIVADSDGATTWRLEYSETADEGLNWSPREFLRTIEDVEWYTTTLYSGDPDNPIYLDEPFAWVMTTQADPDNRWTTNVIARFQVRPWVTGEVNPSAPAAVGFDRIQVLTEAELAALTVEDPNTLYLTTES